VYEEERFRPIQIRMAIMVTGGTSDRESPSTRTTEHCLWRCAVSFRHLRTPVRGSSSHQETPYHVAESRASNHQHVVGSQAVI
jgi:hypothetical protein